MADLYNLLDEVDRQEEEDQQRQHENNLDVLATSSFPATSEDWEQPPHEENDALLPPPILVEAAQDRRKRQLNHQDGSQEESAFLQDDVEAEDLLLLPTTTGRRRIDPKELADLPYMQLRHSWAQELHSPELLPFPGDVLPNMIRSVREREERLDEWGGAPLSSNNNATTGRRRDGNMDSLISSVLRMDADRAQFLACDTLKQRLCKIQKHPLYMREKIDCMSDREVVFLKEFGTRYERHLRRCVLDHLAQDAWKALDEPEMIDEPDLDTHVFCRVTSEGGVAIDNGTEDRPDVQQHAEGTCLIVRYNRIRDFLLDGKVELLM